MHISNRYDFAMLMDVRDGNPNGDPDSFNAPRIDPETGQGIISDVCIKRMVRDYVSAKCGERDGFRVYTRKSAGDASYPLSPGPAFDSISDLCRKYYDVRTFGAVLGNGFAGAQIKGAVQLTFARSLDQVTCMQHAMGECVSTKSRSPRRRYKYLIPYALYLSYGFVSANLASRTGFSEIDLELLWEALLCMFENERSSSRGLMTMQRLFIFQHESSLGNASAFRLFERICVKRRSPSMAPVSIHDYEIELDNRDLPRGIALSERRAN